MNEVQQQLSQNNPEIWQQSFEQFVKNGNTTVEDWLWQWLWCRMDWPDTTYSLFQANNLLLFAPIFGVNVRIEVGENNKRRLVLVKLFESNPYHPDFEELVQVEEHEWRFPAVGNPYIDEPNYKQWEVQLFCKLVYTAFGERGGMDFLVKRAG